jgi:hypothetical protein
MAYVRREACSEKQLNVLDSDVDKLRTRDGGSTWGEHVARNLVSPAREERSSDAPTNSSSLCQMRSLDRTRAENRATA